MTDWLSPMQQTYEYYIVDPGTWKDAKLVKTVTKSNITRDSTAETLGSATIDSTESLGECYLRIYLVTIQNGVKDRHPLGTFLVQSPSSSYDGKIKSISMDAYTPLIELKEKQPTIGFSVLKNENIMDVAYTLVRDNVRAPVVKNECTEKLYNDFVSDTDDTWISFVTDLIANAKYLLDVDELGHVMFAPKQDTASMQPVWTYNDDNSSILYPDITMNHDLYGIPNVVEVVYSNGSNNYYARVVNDDSNSPISTVNRGREIIHRETNPDLIGNPTESQIKEYAEQLLRELSSLECTISYKHGYCPVRVGDCVRLNYTRAGLNGINAKVISQTINCESGCSVSEKAVYNTKLWG